MDDRLFKRLQKIETHIAVLQEIEAEFLYLDAHKKVLFSELFRKSEGKSIAEREANAYTSEEWIAFVKAHAEKEAEYNRAKREYELKLKAYDAEHLTFKNEVPAIRRSS